MITKGDAAYLALVLFSLTATLWLFFRSAARRQWGPQKIKREWIPIGVWQLGLVILVWSAAPPWMAGLRGVFPQIPGEAVPPLSLIIATIVGLAVIGWNNTWLLDWLRPANLITPETLRAGIQFAIIAPWLLGLHGLLSLWIPYSHDTLEQIKASPPFAKLIWSWVSAVIAAPLSEEFVFRGLLLHWLVTAYPEHLFPGGKWSAQGWGRFLFGTWWGGPVESRPSDHSDGNSSTSSVIPLGNSMPVWIAILASSALFAGMHQNQGAAPVTLFLMATFWGWITAQSRSLWPAVLTHMGLNAWTMALTTWGQ